MFSHWFLSLLSVIVLCVGCTTSLPAVPETSAAPTTVVVGRAITVLTGERRRIYPPEVRFIELVNRQTNERYQVEINSPDRRFVLPLPPGDYELNRVQISEGPFMSMADLSADFTIGREPITYVGTWRFGVESPGYFRKVAVSIVSDEEDRVDSVESATDHYPSLEHRPVVMALPDPATAEAKLWEVAPYPRYPRYFRRHWW